MISLKYIFKTAMTRQEKDLAEKLDRIKKEIESSLKKIDEQQGSNYKYITSKVCLTKIKKIIDEI